MSKSKSLVKPIALVAVVVVAALLLWRGLKHEALPAGVAGGNGRIEGVEINIATKNAGRLAEILVREGEFVQAGQVLARMDTAVLEAQLRQAEAQLRQAEAAVVAARSQEAQRRNERAAAEAVIAQRAAELEAARKRMNRSQQLAKSNAIAAQQLDDDTAAYHQARAALAVAQAQLQAAEAAIATAASQVIGAEANVAAARATVERLQVEIEDAVLRSPRPGRIQYRIAQPGEVLGAGGNVLNLLDVSDVYMTIFLSTADAGRLAIGADARLVLDAAPQYVIPARVSFVSDVAQFTPKTVETAEERQKLTFRVRLQIPPELLKKYQVNVKTGLPGMGYVLVDPNAQWPAELQVKLPQ